MGVLSKAAAETKGGKATDHVSRIFISGGAGFIGSHLLRRLLKDAVVERVVVFDNFTSGRHSYIAQ